jgi:hypothetical protein
MAFELKPFGVTGVSLYPGMVRTEVLEAAQWLDLSNSGSPEFIGRASPERSGASLSQSLRGRG